MPYYCNPNKAYGRNGPFWAHSREKAAEDWAQGGVYGRRVIKMMLSRLRVPRVSVDVPEEVRAVCDVVKDLYAAQLEELPNV